MTPTDTPPAAPGPEQIDLDRERALWLKEGDCVLDVHAGYPLTIINEAIRLKTALAAVEKERDAARSEVERLRAEFHRNPTYNVNV